MGTRTVSGRARSRERARASFLIVIMFFAVFVLIVLTELLLVEPSQPRFTPTNGIKDKPDYEQFQAEDYLGLRLSAKKKNAFPVHEDKLPPPPSTNITPPDATWQHVGGTRYKFLVYSAFYEERTVRNIRLIGATKTRGAERVWCRLWFSANQSATVVAKVKMIRENWNLKYSACFILCPLKRNQTIPNSVSVVGHPQATPSNVLKVLQRKKGEPEKDSLVVCVKPLHFTYNRPLQLIEFIEFNMILGATHFIMYNHTVGPQVACVLKHYRSKKLLTLLPWQLNMVSQKEIRTEGLFASLNDCLYRSMYQYAFTALIDLDEFIIPRKEETLPRMLTTLSGRSDSRAAGAFSFQNAFFYLQWKDEPYSIGDPVISSSLITQKKTRRRQKLHPHKQRSKYICRPDKVLEAGNHFVWEFMPGIGALSVPPDHAILHHYRVCEFGGDDCVKTPSIVDRTALKYKEILSIQTNRIYEELKDKCSLPELPTPSPVLSVPAPKPLSPPV